MSVVLFFLTWKTIESPSEFCTSTHVRQVWSHQRQRGFKGVQTIQAREGTGGGKSAGCHDNKEGLTEEGWGVLAFISLRRSRGMETVAPLFFLSGRTNFSACLWCVNHIKGDLEPVTNWWRQSTQPGTWWRKIICVSEWFVAKGRRAVSPHRATNWCQQGTKERHRARLVGRCPTRYTDLPFRKCCHALRRRWHIPQLFFSQPRDGK